MKRLLQVHFLTLFLNILLVSFCFFTKYENIAQALVRPSNYDAAVSYTDAFLIVFEVFLGIQILFSLLGLPFAKEALSVQILFQTVGAICLVLYILLRIHYKAIGYIWGVFSVIPFVIGVVSLISKSIAYRKYSNMSFIENIGHHQEKKQEPARQP